MSHVSAGVCGVGWLEANQGAPLTVYLNLKSTIDLVVVTMESKPVVVELVTGTLLPSWIRMRP